MKPKLVNTEGMKEKEIYNRITLQLTWTHAGRKNTELKFDRLRHDFNSFIQDCQGEKITSSTEGLRI
ncbi:MAG: hypothetical protein JXQ80_09010 [Bacteroidales bacterium]|nr:hypothetical protein [Bacteroidales bacterium]